MDNEKKNPFLTQVHYESSAGTQKNSQTDGSGLNVPKKKISIWLVLFGIFLLLLFLSVLLIFVLVVGGPNNPILTILGIEALSIQNSLLGLTNTIFSVFSLVLFVVLSIGVFGLLFAKKEELSRKKFFLVLSIFSGGSLFITVIVWFALYNFIAEFDFKINIKAELEIKPENTYELTAPYVVNFSIEKAIRLAQSKGKVLSKINWDFNNDGVFDKQGLDSQIDYEVKDSGINKITVILEFTDGNSQTFEKMFTLGKATFSARPDKGPSPLKISFDASNLVSKSNDVKEFRWYFNGADKDPILSDGVKIDHIFDKIGDYEIILITLDSAGVIKKYSRKISVIVGKQEEYISATIKVFPLDQGTAPLNITLDGSESVSKKGDITSYTWTFLKTGEAIAGKTVSKIFRDPGEYEVELVVKDKEGNVGKARKLIKVLENNLSPVAVIKTDPAIISGSIPFTVNFDGSESTDPNNDITDYFWDFNGDSEFDASGEKISYTFREALKYDIVLKVKDSKGNEGVANLSFSLTEIVSNAKIDSDKNSGAAPLLVSFDATSSQVGTGNIVNYEWNFGDGTAPMYSGAKNKHIFYKTGNYTVTLKIFTEGGKEYTASKSIYVRAQGLQSCFVSSKTRATAPTKIKFDPSCSVGEVENWNWNFGDGSISRSMSPTHEFLQSGKYTVILQIIDLNNNVSDYQQIIEIE